MGSVPEQVVEAEHELEIRDALMKLSELHRLVLVMHYLEGFSLAEIAQALRIPLGTVKYRIVRARNAFKKEWMMELKKGGAQL